MIYFRETWFKHLSLNLVDLDFRPNNITWIFLSGRRKPKRLGYDIIWKVSCCSHYLDL